MIRSSPLKVLVLCASRRAPARGLAASQRTVGLLSFNAFTTTGPTADSNQRRTAFFAAVDVAAVARPPDFGDFVVLAVLATVTARAAHARSVGASSRTAMGTL